MDQQRRAQLRNPRETAGWLSVLSFAVRNVVRPENVSDCVPTYFNYYDQPVVPFCSEIYDDQTFKGGSFAKPVRNNRWTWSMFRNGLRKAITVEDLYEPLKQDRSEQLGNRLEEAWNGELQKAKDSGREVSLFRALFKVFWKEYLIVGVMQIFSDVGLLRVLQPLLLGRLLIYFSPASEMSKEEAYWYAAGIVICIFLNVVCQNSSMFRSNHVGMRVRVACCSLMFRKATRLSLSASGDPAAGQLVNLLSNDVSRMDMASLFVNFLWTAPLLSAAVTYMLYAQVGGAGFVGIALILVTAFLQSYAGKLFSKFRSQTAVQTDERIRLMKEIIAGVQVIKMYAWEKPFSSLICDSRKKELRQILKLLMIRGVTMTFQMFTTRMALFVSLITYVLSGDSLKASFVFVIQAYLNTLSFFMGTLFSRAVSDCAECSVSIKRLQKFLLFEEIRTDCDEECSSERIQGIDNPSFQDSSTHKQNSSVNGIGTTLTPNSVSLCTSVPRVKFSDFSCRWLSSSSEDTLKCINLTLHDGELLAVVGPVGSGKSSLLQAVLREIPARSGRVEVHAKVSYACQEPWLFAAPIRQNITFGSPFDRQRYDAVVKACALLADFAQLPHGDMTLVGERGVALSGGQRARVNLARAVYREADLYLLDDPLAAVDSNVAKHLFEECISKLLAGKTRILVTHQIQFLRDLPRIAVIHKGTMQMQGTFSDLLKSNLDYAEVLRMGEQNQEGEPDNEARVTSSDRETRSSGSVKSADAKSDEKPSPKSEQMEESSKGKVKGSLFLQYFLSGTNWAVILLVFLLFIGSQTASSLADSFVGFWTNHEELRTSNFTLTTSRSLDSSPLVLTTTTYVYIYSGIMVSLFCFALARSLVFFYICVRSSQRLHDNMFINLIQAPMRFFNTNPSGRILNRFSKDLGGVDELLPRAILDAAQILLSSVGYVAVTISTNLILIIPVVVLVVLYYTARHVYLKTAKDVKRLEGMTKSPVFTHLNATVQGLTTIRAFSAQSILRQEFDRHQDLHSSAWFMFIASNQSFGMMLDSISWAFIFVVTFSFLVMPNGAYGGDVGLAIAQSMALTESVQYGMRQSAEVISQLLSAERVLEYTNLPRETNLESGQVTPKPDWPQEGRIELRKLTLRYGPEEPPVLKGLNIVISPRDKVGVVGRTGAGKSSLISALFRLAEVQGDVVLDDVDTQGVALQLLRSRISIIPQDPFLFSGTLRKNLDPFQEHADKDIWAALEDVELRGLAAEQQGLDTRVADGGSNLSVGQRQLLCLARAILRANKILMLDEATANVDPQTDAVIQRTIRTKFARCTVLTVAHRLNTIMDSDRVLVMDAGRAVEYDHPHALLQRQGAFHSLVQETGPHMAESLARIAKESYEQRAPACPSPSPSASPS